MAIAASMTILLFVVLGLWIALGVYVWRDAGRRGMNRGLWTVVVLLVPYFLGLIIYLLARSPQAEYRCGQCGQPVRLEFDRCPYCGVRLRGSCPSCGQSVEADWKLCPHCGQPLAEQDGVRPPVRKKDRIWLVPLIALLVLAALIVGLLTFNTVTLTGGAVAEEWTDEGVSASWAQIGPEALEAVEEAAQWYEESVAAGDGTELYILEFQTEDRRGGILLFTERAEALCPVSCTQMVQDGRTAWVQLTVDAGTAEGTPAVWVFWQDVPELPWTVEGPEDSNFTVNWTAAEDNEAVEALCTQFSANFDDE